MDDDERGGKLMDYHLLSIITFIPALAALILAVFLRGEDEAAQLNAKWVAMFATGATFLVSLFVLFDFDPSDTGFQFVEESSWLLGMQYRLGVDIYILSRVGRYHSRNGREEAVRSGRAKTGIT